MIDQVYYQTIIIKQISSSMMYFTGRLGHTKSSSLSLKQSFVSTFLTTHVWIQNQLQVTKKDLGRQILDPPCKSQRHRVACQIYNLSDTALPDKLEKETILAHAFAVNYDKEQYLPCYMPNIPSNSKTRNSFLISITRPNSVSLSGNHVLLT